MAGGCGAGATVAGAEDATNGVWTLENVKGRAVIGGSSRTEGVSEAWGIDAEGGCLKALHMCHCMII